MLDADDQGVLFPGAAVYGVPKRRAAGCASRLDSECRNPFQTDGRRRYRTQMELAVLDAADEVGHEYGVDVLFWNAGVFDGPVSAFDQQGPQAGRERAEFRPADSFYEYVHAILLPNGSG